MEALARAGQVGPVWDAVARAATEYCLSTVVAWLRTGHVPLPCKLDGIARAELNRSWTGTALAAVTTEVTKSAVAHFRNRLVRGMWRVADGVTLVTELEEGCAMALPGALRSHANRWQGATAAPAAPECPPDVDADARAASIMRAEGYRRVEVAHVLHLPARTR